MFFPTWYFPALRTDRAFLISRRKRHKKSSSSPGDGASKGESSSRHRHHHHHHHRHHQTSSGVSHYMEDEDVEPQLRRRHYDELRPRRPLHDAGSTSVGAGSFQAWDSATPEVAAASSSTAASGKRPRKSSTHAGGHSLGLCGEDSIGLASSTARDGNYASQR